MDSASATMSWTSSMSMREGNRRQSQQAAFCERRGGRAADGGGQLTFVRVRLVKLAACDERRGITGPAISEGQRRLRLHVRKLRGILESEGRRCEMCWTEGYARMHVCARAQELRLCCVVGDVDVDVDATGEFESAQPKA